jgi:Flp pilus assembly protein TadB
MANNNSQTGMSNKGNRWISVAWVLGIAAVIITCLVLQKTALLYVISTVGITILLIIVATANLKSGNNGAAEL